MSFTSRMFIFNLLIFFFNAFLIPHGTAFPVQEHHRISRQANSDRSQIIDNIFQIPIQTLLAVNNLVQSSRGFRRRQSSPQSQVSAQRSLAADVAGVGKQTDGSSFRI